MNIRDEHRIFQVSQSQWNIWGLEQLLPDTPMNNICTSIRIKGQMDVDLAVKSINLVLEKDLSLRTRFALVNDRPYQYHVPHKEEQFPFLNFSLADEEGFVRWEKTVAQIPLNVCDKPLYRFFIYRLDEKSGGILIKVHHLIADGWSIVELANRLFSTYLALLNKKNPQLSDMPSYELHVNREKEYFASAAFEKDRKYWEKRLSEFSDERAFLKKNNNVNISNIGDRCSFMLSQQMNYAIDGFCKKHRVAPFAVYYIALAIHLKRMSGCDRVCIGTPVLNRPDFIDKQTGGMFVNTLPFFFRIDTELTTEELIFSLTEQWYDLLRHQRFPFSEIHAMAGQGDEENRRFFDIALSYQDSKIFRDRDTTMLFSGKWLYSGYQNEQLIIHLSSLDGESRFSVDYDYLIQFYSHEDICNFHKHITKILGEILLYPDLPVSQLNLLCEDELEKVVYTFNDKRNDNPPTTVCEEFLRAVSLNPLKAALILEGAKMTYKDLYRRALLIAERIREACRGKKPKENVVALCLPRGFDLVASMLAASFSGGAWVNIPPELPPARAAHLIKDSGAAVIVTANGYAPYFDQEPLVPVIFLDGLSAADDIAASPAGLPDGRDLAYIIYTSGSTGTPKGAMIEHASLVNFSLEMDEIFAGGGVLSICNTGFDVFVLETISALLCGRTVILASEEKCNNPVLLAELIKRYAAKFFAITPSRLEAYIQNPDFAQAIGNIESIVCGGEPLTGDLLNRLERLTKAKIYNQYGPSETTIGVSCKCLNQSVTVTAGKPMANCRLYVLDENLKPLPVGAAGTLYIGGDCVGRGYVSDLAATQKNFTEDKFKTESRMYNSGDLARWEGNGEITILGRKDAQIKLNGCRIEPQEIAAALMRHPQIGQAAVNVTKRGSGGFITAYYVSPSDIFEDELTTWLQSFLPSYMIPHFFVRVEKITLTANGKTDFDALPAPVASEKQPSAAVGKTERQVLDVFKRILKTDDVTSDSAFFAAGGDSLNALTAVAEISRVTGCDAINPSDLRRLATPLKIAEKIDRSRAGGGEDKDASCGIAAHKEKDGILPVLRESYPLTPIQKSILFSSFSDPAGVAYNMPGGFEIDGALDKERLQDAIGRLIASEDTLRTAFVFEGSDCVAKICPSAPFKLESIQAQSYEDALKGFVRPFDLSAPPLLRAGLWQRDGKTVLLVDVHHIINDGEGSPLLFAKLDRLYRGETANQNRLSYKDYACYLTEKAAGDKKEYWQKRLAGVKNPPDLFKEMRVSQNPLRKGGGLTASINTERAAAIDGFCREKNITPFTLFAAAFGILLSELSGQNDFIIGTPVAGRTLPETREMLGAFINTLPLRLKTDREKPLDAYLQQVEGDIADMLDNTSVTQEELLTFAGTDRARRGGLYSVMFSMRPDYQRDFYFGGKHAVCLPAKAESVKMDLVLEAFGNERGYTFLWEYDEASLNEKTAGLCARSLIEIIEDITRNPAQKTSEVKTLTDGDAKDILKAAAGKTEPYPVAMIDAMADDCALCRPNDDAIIFGDTHISFDAFRKRSDSIAAQLVRRGIKRGDVVGIYCGRTPDLLCGVFGILKCGAAYLPLSSSLPKERIRQMLQISGAAAVLCDNPYIETGEDKCIKCVISEEMLGFRPVGGRKESDTAQVLFTSGSTGEPKGVTISHRSLCGLLANLKKMYQDDGVTGGMLCSSSPLFDSFTLEVIAPISQGLSVVLADESEVMTSWMLAKRMQNGVQAMFSTPTRLNVFLEDESFVKALSGLKMLQAGGEAMPDALAKKLKSICGGGVYNLYGPVEATVFVTAWKATDKEKAVIGYPADNARVYILDEKMRPRLPMAAGEIYIGGDCLSGGYIGRSDLSKQAFVDSPFLGGERLYKTGDMARLLFDGRIDYLGRKDRQIKLNGQRIELDEISGAIIKTERAADAAVVLKKKAEGQASDALVAFVVPASGRAFDENALRGDLDKALPRYMIPSEIICIQAIPLTPTGKADVLALSRGEYKAAPAAGIKKETAQKENTADEPKEPPAAQDNQPKGESPKDREGVRQVLLDLWKEVLAADNIDCDKSFFEQGGTSLACMNLLIRYFKMGWEIKLTVFYETPTLNGQLDFIMSLISQNSEMQNSDPKDGDGDKAATAKEDAAEKSGENPETPEKTDSNKKQDKERENKETNNKETNNKETNNKENAGNAVLVTGASGFLGAHIVYELINSRRETVFCMVRENPDRLLASLNYYFTEQWVRDNSALIIPVCGDIGLPDLGIDEELSGRLYKRIKTVYHCAADVRHYVSEDASYKANIDGTKNVLSFCERANAKIGFISTLSVGGEKIERQAEGRFKGLEEVIFDESCFDIGQNWRDNVYVRSKFLAESEVQKAAQKGLKTKIIRIGRLVGRASDGKFQKNKQSNYFYNVITGLAGLGAVPAELAKQGVEMTPVDCCARAAVLAMDDSCKVAHISNPHLVSIEKIVAELTGAQIKQTGLKEYKEMVLNASLSGQGGGTMQMAAILNSSLALDTAGFIKVRVTNLQTDRYLKERGFVWPQPDVTVILKDFK